LADLGEEGLPVLLTARKDEDLRVSRRAAAALVRVGEPAVPALVEALPRGGARGEGILVQIGAPAVPALGKVRRGKEKPAHAARVLGAMGSRARPAVPALGALLLDGKAAEPARVAAARALGQIGPEQPEGPPEQLTLDPVLSGLTAALAGPPA